MQRFENIADRSPYDNVVNITVDSTFKCRIVAHYKDGSTEAFTDQRAARFLTEVSGGSILGGRTVFKRVISQQLQSEVVSQLKDVLVLNSGWGYQYVGSEEKEKDDNPSDLNLRGVLKGHSGWVNSIMNNEGL